MRAPVLFIMVSGMLYGNNMTYITKINRFVIKITSIS